MSFNSARRRIDDLLREVGSDIGPVRDVEHGEIDPDEDHQSVPGLLTDWDLVAAWLDPEDAAPFVVRLCSESLASYQRAGLLHEALYGMED